MPYTLVITKGSMATDYSMCQQFCEWLHHQHTRNPNFPVITLVTDKLCLIRVGTLSFFNPHAICRNPFQQRFGVNLCASFVNSTLIGPYETPACLNRESYLAFLRDVLPRLLEGVFFFFNLRLDMLFLH